MIAHPHHDGSALHIGGPAPHLGDRVPVRIRVPESFGEVEGVWLRSVRDAEPHYDAAAHLGTADGWSWWGADLSIVNPVQNYRWLVRADGRPHWINAEGLSTRDVPDARDFRICAFEAPPAWVNDSVMYQIFPDRFARSEAADRRELPEWAIACDWDRTEVIGRGPETPYQFFGGDLDGVRSKLDHIQALGATVVYLTPMFPARSNHRYDASDFSGVDPLLGGDEAFVALIADIHARGLKVIGDLTTNHSGDAHEWFRRSYGNPSAPESEYYYFSEDNTRYVAWLGVPSLPKFNWNSEGLRRRFILDDDSMVARWLKPPFNLDGWRIDVGNMTGRMGADDLNHEVASLIREAMRRINPDTMLLAESTSDAAPDFQGDTWQGAMTYTNFTRPLWQWLARDSAPGVDLDLDATAEHHPDVHPELAPGPVAAGPVADGGGVPKQAWPDYFGVPQRGPDRIEAEDFLATHLDFAAPFPWPVRLANMNAIDTHDTARAASAVIAGGQRVGVALQFTLPGIPMVFMGDEFGLQGFNGEDSRTPMPWDDPDRILEDLRPLYAELADLRRTHPALVGGGIRWLHAEGDAIVFVREHAEGSVLVAASRAAFSGVEFPAALVGAAHPEPLWSSGRIAATFSGATATAEGRGVVVLEGEGPAAALWLLPGVTPPAAAAPSP
ncbi:glycoside hydrolase family 13 protein [Arthrobacter halodurans]|uniref:Alpha-amylase family glycosyl hydrolase n=1 Tax=Arthrobacter halodurans TaxID=516699 RepID=A0ABV4USI2_9MICC